VLRTESYTIVLASKLTSVDFFSLVPYVYLSTQNSSLSPSVRGAVAQLGERLNGIQEVEGSIPFGSTNSQTKFSQ
jgi:hypothetical protein